MVVVVDVFLVKVVVILDVGSRDVSNVYRGVVLFVWV